MIKMIHFVCKILALNQDFIIVPLCSLNEHLSSRLYFSVFFLNVVLQSTMEVIQSLIVVS